LTAHFSVYYCVVCLACNLVILCVMLLRVVHAIQIVWCNCDVLTTIRIHTKKTVNIFDLTEFSLSRTCYFTILCRKVWTDYLTIMSKHFLSKHIHLYIRIVVQIHNDAKSTQYFKMNFKLHLHAITLCTSFCFFQILLIILGLVCEHIWATCCGNG